MRHFKDSLLLLFALCVAGFNGNINASSKQVKSTNDETILHAWTWSFNTIKNNMKDIANAGYTFVQTSPANECVIGDNGGMELFGNGKWYYHYQPTDWKIGNYQLGSKEDFKAMCDEAKKYGVKVIVDVLPNHTAIDDTKVSKSLDDAVGGHENLFHANGRKPITDYNDRLQCTTGEMGKLPDVNTENPDFQAYYMKYVNDLLACGVRGFRYDTAKHIGLPSDPLDGKATQNDFWDIATGRKSVKGIKMSLPEDSLFIYGEVLQDKNVKELEYGEYMDLTASNYGGLLREVLKAGNTKTQDIMNWCHPLAPQRLVTWVESHDTYCNEHVSASINNTLIRMGWVFLTARQAGIPLFYSRPEGSSCENVWGNNKIGERGNSEFKHPEVAAVNKFRKAMSGKEEKIFTSTDGKVIEVARGNSGVALINLSSEPQKIKLATTLPSGKYYDKVYKTIFIVKNGKISGTLKGTTSYIIY